MSSPTFTQQMLEIDEEIEKTNEKIRQCWNSVLLLKSGETGDNIKFPEPNARSAWADSLITNFITRSFIHKIYGYPEFDAVLQKALVAFSIKQINREVSLEIGQVISVEEVPDVYAFSHDDCIFYTSKKVVVRTSDRALHSLSFFEVSNTLPNPVDFNRYKFLCKTNNVALPLENDAKEKEKAIKDAATRILTDIESYKVDIIRAKPCSSVHAHGKEKVVARRFQEIAHKRGQLNVKTTYDSQLESLDQKSEYIASFSRANLQEKLEKSINQRLTDERINIAKSGLPRQPKIMDGFTRIPTFASKSEKDKMAEIAHQKFEELKQMEALRSRPTSKGPDLFDLHNFTTKSDFQYYPSKIAQQTQGEAAKSKIKNKTLKRISNASSNPLHPQINAQGQATASASTSNPKNTKISYDDYKRRKQKK